MTGLLPSGRSPLTVPSLCVEDLQLGSIFGLFPRALQHASDFVEHSQGGHAAFAAEPALSQNKAQQVFPFNFCAYGALQN
jgi:hypothetical protein